MTTKQATTTKRDTTKRAAKAQATFALVALCDELKRDPKIIRAKARRNRAALIPHLNEATSDERWIFKASSRAFVIATLFKRS